MARKLIWSLQHMTPWTITSQRELWFIVVLLSFALTNDLLWSSVIPFKGFPYGAPDEIHHFEVPRFIYRHHRYPIFGKDKDLYIRVPPGSEDNINTRIYGWYALAPRGSYIFGAATMYLIPGSSPDGTIYGARLSSVIGHLLLIHLTYRIALTLFPTSSFIHLGTPTLVAFIPQVTFVGAYFNADVFTMVSTTLTLYLWVRGMKNRFPVTDCVLLGFGLGLAALGRRHGWLVSIGITPFVLALSMRGEIKRILFQLLCITLPPAAIFEAWCAFNYHTYGDISASRVFIESWSADRPFLVPLAQQGFNFLSFLTQTNWLEMSFKSFWGVFGYMYIQIHPFFYQSVFALCVTSSLGLLLGIFCRLRKKELNLRSWRYQILSVFALSIVLLTIASGYASLHYDFQPQGRYLFPTLVPICIFLLLGLRELFPISRIRSAVFAVMCISFVFLNLISVLVYIMPYSCFHG